RRGPRATRRRWLPASLPDRARAQHPPRHVQGAEPAGGPRARHRPRLRRRRLQRDGSALEGGVPAPEGRARHRGADRGVAGRRAALARGHRVGRARAWTRRGLRGGAMTDADIDARVRASLEALGVPYEVMQIDPDFADTAQFCEKYGIPLANSANSIVVASKK